MTYIDKTFNLYFTALGGENFLGLFVSLLIIITIIMVFIKNFDV